LTSTIVEHIILLLDELIDFDDPKGGQQALGLLRTQASMAAKISEQFNLGLYAIPNVPLIKAGDNLGELLYKAATVGAFTFANHDILVVAQKIISKAENAVVRLSTINPSTEAVGLAKATGRDPRLCQVYIDESSEILGTKGRMVITRHRLGFQCTGAGVDRSNVAHHDEGVVVLLPKDPDESAQRIRLSLEELTGKKLAVIVNDSFGKADRDGSVGISVGLSGIRHLEERHQRDLFENTANSRIALVDEVAAAASILMGQADERTPAVVVRGVQYTRDEHASITNLLIQ
jgi:coenzyme F420-0:L-glutamate ligase/coenzyme F420-1:gamma-L-glutamate ligase